MKISNTHFFYFFFIDILFLSVILLTRMITYHKGGFMPESLKKFETHQKNYIKTHPKGIDGSKEKIVIEFLEQLIKENNLAICVPFDCFNDILKSNKVKNQLELGAGSSLSFDGRKQATHELFESSLDLDYTKYPKYGFILEKSPLRHFLQDSDLLFQY